MGKSGCVCLADFGLNGGAHAEVLCFLSLPSGKMFAAEWTYYVSVTGGFIRECVLWEFDNESYGSAL